MLNEFWACSVEIRFEAESRFLRSSKWETSNLLAGNSGKPGPKHTHTHSMHSQRDLSHRPNLVQSSAVCSENFQQQPVHSTWHMVRGAREIHGFNLSVLTDKWIGRKRCCTETCCSAPSIWEHRGEKKTAEQNRRQGQKACQRLGACTYCCHAARSGEEVTKK